MTRLEQIIEFYPDENLLSADGFEDCVIGVTYDSHVSAFRLVYSRSKCIEVLMSRDKMSMDEADEFFDFNVKGAFVGRKTPLYVDDEMFKFDSESYRTFDDIETNDEQVD